MPGGVLIGGPLFWFLVGVLFLAGMLAAYVAIDVTRRAWFPGTRLAERARWWYLVPQAAYLVLMLLGQFNAIPMAVTGIVVLCTPLALGQQVVYLLRVVFPKPPAVKFEPPVEDEVAPEV